MDRTACTEPQCLYKSALYLTVELTSIPPMDRTACTEPQCLYKGALYLTVELYLYSPYGPYGLYRASVHTYMRKTKKTQLQLIHLFQLRVDYPLHIFEQTSSSSGSFFCTRSVQYFTMYLWGVWPLSNVSTH